jgi:hypothetical protein
MKGELLKVAVIGTGNVGATLALALKSVGHDVVPGVRSTKSFSHMAELLAAGMEPAMIEDAVAGSDVVILAVPAPAAADAARNLGDTSGKVIIDAMNIVGGSGPEGYTNTGQAILDHTKSRDVVKCFNTTGYENMKNPVYSTGPIDMFMAGDSKKGKGIAAKLAQDIGFGKVFDLGGNDKFDLIEQLANVWIDLAIFQDYGMDLAIRIVKRSE